MLQYAFGRAHELRGHTVTFNKKEFGSTVRDREETDFLPAPHLNQLDAQHYIFAYGLDMFKTKVVFGPSVGEFRDTGVVFDPRYMTIDTPMTLRGLWWNENYFKDMGDRIREEFSPAFPISPEAEALTKRMQGGNSVFMHVRRGDYTIPAVAECHNSMPLSYYEKALKVISDKHPNPQVFIFSDDTEWCSENMPWGEVVRIGNRYIDLWLMSQCRHAIIANSSYSWWGAWLGDYQKDRVVVGPERWFTSKGTIIRNGTQNELHFMPDRWVCLSV
jgi:hypothetical protein